jgi:hypothetical protein
MTWRPPALVATIPPMVAESRGEVDAEREAGALAAACTSRASRRACAQREAELVDRMDGADAP